MTFVAVPSSLEDAPAALLLSHKGSAQLDRSRRALKGHLHTLRLLPPLSHVDADQRRIILINGVEDKLRRLAEKEATAWDHEKIKAGLYGFTTGADTDGNTIEVYDTSEYFIRLTGVAFLICFNTQVASIFPATHYGLLSSFSSSSLARCILLRG